MDLTVIGSAEAKAGFALLIKELALRVPTTPPRVLDLLMLIWSCKAASRANTHEGSETQSVWRQQV